METKPVCTLPTCLRVLVHVHHLHCKCLKIIQVLSKIRVMDKRSYAYITSRC